MSAIGCVLLSGLVTAAIGVVLAVHVNPNAGLLLCAGWVLGVVSVVLSERLIRKSDGGDQ